MSGSIEHFVKDALEGDWDRLKELNPSGCYDPHDPVADSDWLKCPGRSFDCDDCDLSRTIYREVWGLDAPLFRGDTMNSFRTAFGRERITHNVVDVPWVYDGSAADRRFVIPKRLIDRIRGFNWMYHAIGNFIPLPNKSVDGRTLNTYRAGVWKDYFAPFLKAVQMYLEGTRIESDAAFLPIPFVRLMDANGFFWDRYCGRFEEYVHDFFLDGYLDREGRVVEFHQFFWWDQKMKAADYVASAERYLDLVESIIVDRGQRIVDFLQVRALDESKDCSE